MNNINVFILCAGEGKRLRPHTEHTPKCMVPYKGKPLLQYQLDNFKSFNLETITLIGGYHHETLPTSYPIVVNLAFANTNMLYSLFCAESKMDNNSDLIISYGDIIYHPNVLKALLDATYPVNVVTDIHWKRYWENRMEDPLKDAETFRWDPQSHQIFELGQKPTSLEDIQGQYIGLFKISSSFVPQFKQAYHNFQTSHPDHYAKAYMTDFLQYLIEQNHPVYGVPIQGHWAEFDTISDLNLNIGWL